MRIAFPNVLKEWHTDFKPTDGEVALVAAVTIFARLFGVKTFQQWYSEDIRAFIRPKNSIEKSSKTLLKDLQAQGAIEYINDIDGIETIRLNPELNLGDQGLFNYQHTFEIEIKDEGVIMALSFFMGRMVDIHDGSEIKEMKIAPKIRANGKLPKGFKPTKVVIPQFYSDQFKHFQYRHGEITQ